MNGNYYNNKNSIPEVQKRGSKSKKETISYQLSFKPNDQSQMPVSNDRAEYKNFVDGSDSEYCSPIGKLVSFQDMNSNPKNNEESNFESQKNLYKKNLINKNEFQKENKQKNILGLRNNFEEYNLSENERNNHQENADEEEVNEYRDQDSNENECNVNRHLF